MVVKVTFPAATSGLLSSEEVWAHLEENVKGDCEVLSDEALAGITDLSKVRKYYKLNGLNWLDGVKDEKAKRTELESLVLGGMALRGI